MLQRSLTAQPTGQQRRAALLLARLAIAGASTATLMSLAAYYFAR